MAPVRLGFLTTARINDAILDGARRSEAVEVVAVGGRDRAKAEAYAQERGIPRAHGSYEALLADSEVDAVYVALPSALHVQWATRAFEAGKHVLVEKPFSTQPDEVERAFDVAEGAGLVLMEGFMYRHQPQAKRLRELVREGAVGELRLVRAQFSFLLDRPDDIRLRPELGGGALLDVGTYCVNVSRLVAGERRGPEGRAGRRPDRRRRPLRRRSPLPRRRARTFRLRLRPATAPRGRGRRLGGDAAPLAAFGSDDGVLELRRGDEVETVPLPATSRYQLEVENFAAAVRGDEPPLLGRDESVGQARALAALLVAAA